MAKPLPSKEKNRAAVALAKLGASKRGVARARKLSRARRVAIARKPIRTMWKKNKRVLTASR